jgi:phosphoribosyl 1,2-cyclic phosphodiesterase/CheY-like chemotaxis protein
MRIKFWGARGSIPAPGFGTARFGGNTPCVQVTTAAGAELILDCGTGARDLGDHLLSAYPAGLSGHILLTHTHWDHIQGFPFFAPVFREGFTFTVHAPAGGAGSLSEALSGQMQYTYFPVNLEQLDARIECVDLQEGEFSLDGMRVRTHYLNHPGLTLGYRLECGGVTVVYATDHEPFGVRLFRDNLPWGSIAQILHDGDRAHARFLAQADLLIHDCQYTAVEYEQKRNWGHSPMEYVVAIAVAAGVKRLALFHHDPSHDDRFLARMEQDAIQLAQALGSPLEVFVAHEGQSVALRERAGAGRVARPVPLQAAPAPAAAHILIVGDHKPLRDALLNALLNDGHTLVTAQDGQEALDLAASVHPDLLLLDLESGQRAGLEFLRALRRHADAHLRDMPVLLLTAPEDEQQVRLGFAAGASDAMHKPVTPAQLRTRVRTWLDRLSVTRQG